jgi:hypothetical protein
MIRQKIAERPDAAGKMLSLLYQRGIRAADVERNHRTRGDAENRIKGLKQDFGAGSFNLKAFFPTEATLIFAMIAYNLMAIFRIFVLQEKTQKT